jgi:electron transfer flavoprotein beta subunit
VKILVCIKHVPDTETKIRVAADGRSIDEGQVNKWVISPYDEYALEQALRFRENTEGEVVLACVGRDAAQATLRQGLAMGADRAVLVADDRLDRVDALVRARALAAICRDESADLVLLGKYGVGTDEAQTAAMLAELLGWPHAGAVSELTLVEQGFQAKRAIEGAVESIEGRLPAVVDCEKGLNEPRYPSLKGIMQAKKKPIQTRSAEDVGITDDDLGANAMLVWESLELPEPRSVGRLIETSDGAEQAAAELARLLHEEAKVI